MAWKLENIRKDPNSKEMYADLFISQITEEPKTACLFTIGDARTVEIILEKYKNTQFVVFDYPALIKFLEFAKPANLLKAVPLRYDWESEDTFLKFVETEIRQIYNINNMSFDLIIANPPYGKSSSLSKKIVNKMLEVKVAKEMIVLAPPRTFYDVCTNLVDYSYKGVCGNLFDSVSEANDVLIALARLDNNINTKYTSYLDFVLDEKEKTYNNVVKAYNNSHEPFYTDVSSKRVDFRYKSLFKGVSDKVIFAIPYWTPFSGIREGECKKYNFDETPINWEAKTSAQGAVLKNNTVKRNFARWWYSCVGGLNTLKENKTLMYLILRCVKDVYSGTPGLSAYFEFIPNLDWSRTWTDAEILKELGLPENFLEEKE